MGEPDSETTSSDRFLDLFRGAQAGHAGRLDELLRQTYTPVVDFLRRRFGERQLRHRAEDVAVETLIRVAAHLGSCRADDEAGYWSWVLTIARNEALRLWRSDEFQNAEVLAPAMLERLREAQAAAQARSDLELPDVARPEPGALSPLQLLLPLLEPLVTRLGESRQLLLGLRYVEGLTYREIATEIGTSPAAAKRRLQRVHTRLFRELEAAVQEYDGPGRDRVVAAFRVLEGMRQSG